jgi:hypothetical protein
MHAFVIGLLVLTALLAPAAPAPGQVHVNIGINLPAPPPLVVVPEIRTVQYVKSSPYNLFVYNNQYWAFSNGGWHVASAHNGPWIVVAPQFVPRPLLLVPVRYYHVPPGHWKQWQRAAPPRWHDEWGRDWAEKRQWRAAKHDRDHDHERGRGRDDDHERGHGRGHDDDRGPGRGHGRGR